MGQSTTRCMCLCGGGQWPVDNDPKKDKVGAQDELKDRYVQARQ